jgi:hypothetical protein
LDVRAGEFSGPGYPEAAVFEAVTVAEAVAVMVVASMELCTAVRVKVAGWVGEDTASKGGIYGVSKGAVSVWLPGTG